MDVFEAVRTVLAVRQFEDKAIDDATVREIVEAAHLTGSSINGQPWHFIVVQNKETLQKLGSMARSGPYIAQAPLAIVVGIEQSIYGVSDASRAIQSMILVAWDKGIGSNWVGFNNMAEVRPLLGIPENIEIVAIVPFGYPVKSIGKGHKKRKPLGEVAHKERWDQPFQ
jgi:nitroreductase